MFQLLITLLLAQAQLTPQNLYIQGYAQNAFSQYLKASEEAQTLNQLVKNFIANPTQDKLEAAKAQWIVARKIYSQTETYRFFDSPIDDADGPEGLINAWPIDEAYIDSVKGKSNSGIINDRLGYPVIDKETLMSLNEKNGEKNISTGWHAIEFLLWGQDFSTNGPGARSFEDYVDGKIPNADRRRLYLSVITELLVAHIQFVAVEWNPASGNNYYASFVNAPDSLSKVVESLRFFAGEELSIERMFVAYDMQDQEDEHSCFSDTTHYDLYYNYLGIKNTLLQKFNGISLVSLIADKDAALASQIEAQAIAIDVALFQFPAPFDQAIFIDSSRETIKLIIDSLQVLAESVEQAKANL